VGSRPGDDAFLGRRVLENHALGRRNLPAPACTPKGESSMAWLWRPPPAALFRR